MMDIAKEAAEKRKYRHNSYSIQFRYFQEPKRPTLIIGSRAIFVQTKQDGRGNYGIIDTK